MVIQGDAYTELKKLPSEMVQCCITSPPYWNLRDYKVIGQLGLEDDPNTYIHNITRVFMQVYRVLKPNGTLWLNIGDTYMQRDHGIFKKGNLAGIPWRVALQLQQLGWNLIQDIIWHKPNPMPESVNRRCTRAHEYIFLFSKTLSYKFTPLMEKSIGTTHTPRFGGTKYGDNPDYHIHSGKEYKDTGLKRKRDVWTIGGSGYRGSHLAPFPEKIPHYAISAGTEKGDLVLDPFLGSGTTALVAQKLDRQCIGIDLDISESIANGAI